MCSAVSTRLQSNVLSLERLTFEYKSNKSVLNLEILHPMIDRVNRVINFMNHLLFVRKAFIPIFRPIVPFLHVKKFVVVGVKTWILVLSFEPKLNNFS